MSRADVTFTTDVLNRADALIQRFIEEAAAVGIAEPMARKVLALDLDEMELPPTFRAAVKARVTADSADTGSAQ